VNKVNTPLNPHLLQTIMPLKSRQTYSVRDTILYALGVGAGASDAPGSGDLRFVYEDGLQALPTMANVLAHPGPWQMRPELRLDWQLGLHAEQRMVLHRPIPVEGSVSSTTSIHALFDKGREKGALLYVKREIEDSTGSPLATIIQGTLLRGNGGFASEPKPSPLPAAVPERAPDASVELRTRPEQGMIYRLSGDYNPLHIDPETAARGGFERPILHGLCTFGVAGRAVLSLLCQNQPAALREIGGRFTAPVFPGESIITDVWRTGPFSGMFRSRVEERDRVVIDYGTVQHA
jgi:acyl dehydratase